MLAEAEDFGVVHTVTMCLPAEIPVFRERFGNRLSYNAWIAKQRIDEPDEGVYRLLELFLVQGISMLKLWAAPRGRDWGLLIDAPYRVEAIRRAQSAGVRTVMVHVADPDTSFRTIYADQKRYGSKLDQYVGFRRLLEEFPDVTWIAAHMGGDPEHPDHLEAMLERYPNLHLDTSATKWQVREVSARRDAIRTLICRFPQRFLFGVDLVTRHHLTSDHYVSRYWCQRTLWESNWRGPSPIADPDHPHAPDIGDEATSPLLHGLHLPMEVLEQVYYGNAQRILRLLR
jgi:hypothetical protein